MISGQSPRTLRSNSPIDIIIALSSAIGHFRTKVFTSVAGARKEKFEREGTDGGVRRRRRVRHAINSPLLHTFLVSNALATDSQRGAELGTWPALIPHKSKVTGTEVSSAAVCGRRLER
jgi:hypothetical protein